MKHLVLTQLTAFFISVILLSCSESAATASKERDVAEKPLTEAKSNTTATFQVLLIKHSVADFHHWKPAYVAHDSVRKNFGLTDLDLLTKVNDPNLVLIVEKIAGIQKAKEFTTAPNLKETMQQAGVIGAPSFYYFDVIRNEDAIIATKDRVVVTHHVKDFDAWLKVFDAEGKNTRAGEGMVDRVLARATDDPNFVMIVFAVTDMEKAKSAISSEAKKKIMERAGVEGVPAIEFYRQAP